MHHFLPVYFLLKKVSFFTLNIPKSNTAPNPTEIQHMISMITIYCSQGWTFGALLSSSQYNLNAFPIRSRGTAFSMFAAHCLSGGSLEKFFTTPINRICLTATAFWLHGTVRCRRHASAAPANVPHSEANANQGGMDRNFNPCASVENICKYVECLLQASFKLCEPSGGGWSGLGSE